jgi:DMSO/TMAO reductase YedYZ molybdopterin-dependent catalytic subunit
MIFSRLGMAAISVLLAACVGSTAKAADAPGVRLDGAVLHEQVFTLPQLKALPAQTVEMSYKTKTEQLHNAWTGVRLWDLVKLAGLKNDSGKNAGLRHTLMVHGKDGYVVALSVGEMDPMEEGKQVILAYSQAGQAADLAGLRLVVPGDSHAARQVHDVVEIEVR